jgi:putative ABC transport system substrate-binding protein
MAIRIRRREFIALLGSGVAGLLAANAQQMGKVWRIGLLSGASRDTYSRLYAGFQLGMRELGYVEGKDFVGEARYADGKSVG